MVWLRPRGPPRRPALNKSWEIGAILLHRGKRFLPRDSNGLRRCLVPERDHDQRYLTLGRPGYSGRSFLGGTKLSTRTGLFVGVGLLAIVAFVGLIVHVNDRLSKTILGLDRAQALSAQVTLVERRQADLRSREKQYLLSRDDVLAGDIQRFLDEAARALDVLAAHPDADELTRPVATLRDGFLQYDQHLGELMDTAAGGASAAGVALRQADAALAPRVATSGRRDGPALLARINQLGSEMVLTGDPANLDQLREAYGTLARRMAKSSLPRADRAVITDLLARHQASMMALIAARATVNENAQRFDDIQQYVAPSLDSLRQVSLELIAERTEAVAEARVFAAASVIGGGAAILLWLLVLGVILMRSVTRPVEALARAASALARGDRSATVPARGNRDAVGVLARAFDDWIAATADAEHLRQDLEHAQAKTRQAVDDMAEESRRARAVEDEMAVLRVTLEDYRRDMDEMESLLADLAEDQAVAEAAVASAPIVPTAPPLAAPLSGLARAQAEVRDMTTAPTVVQPAAARDPAFARLSEHLAEISHQASAAIVDVELTDALMRDLSAARDHLARLDGQMAGLRDEFNGYLFAQAPGPASVGGDGPAQDPRVRQRLAALRDAVDQTERSLAGAAGEMARVTDTAQRLAASASDEARLATDQLVAQSDYLKGLLDTLAHRTRPQATEPSAPAPGRAPVIRRVSGPQDGNAG